jgi:hypothetical protein
MARGTKISRAVFRALYGIPIIRPVHVSDRSTYGLYIGLPRLILRSHHRASTHTLSHKPIRTRARTTMLSLRCITLVGVVALVFGLAAFVDAVPPTLD